MTFIKYPKVENQQKHTLPAGAWTVQEKLDGANASIQYYRESNGVDFLLVCSRNQEKAEVCVDGSFKATKLLQASTEPIGGLVQHVEEHAEAIIAFMRLNTVSVIYGEWLVKHTIEYPSEMWRKFYVFDILGPSGMFLDPQRFWPALLELGFSTVRRTEINFDDAPGSEDFRKATQSLAASIEDEESRLCRTEGAVFKRYDLDAQWATNQYGGRVCYKDVLPEFREDHHKNPAFPTPTEPTSIEERLIAHLPERSIEKVYLKITAQSGWDNKLFVPFMRAVWQELFEEHLIAAIEKEKAQVVNLKALRSLCDARTRACALAHSQAAPVAA